MSCLAYLRSRQRSLITVAVVTVAPAEQASATWVADLTEIPMRATMIFVARLILALVPTFALAQNGGNIEGSDAHSTTRTANTAGSSRTLPPSRAAAPDTTGSINRGKGKGTLGGIDIKGICIGCGAK